MAWLAVLVPVGAAVIAGPLVVLITQHLNSKHQRELALLNNQHQRELAQLNHQHERDLAQQSQRYQQRQLQAERFRPFMASITTAIDEIKDLASTRGGQFTTASKPIDAALATQASALHTEPACGQIITLVDDFREKAAFYGYTEQNYFTLLGQDPRHAPRAVGSLDAALTDLVDAHGNLTTALNSHRAMLDLPPEHPASE